MIQFSEKNWDKSGFVGPRLQLQSTNYMKKTEYNIERDPWRMRWL
ncbi:hypothetical protein LEP1GSC065_2795 [Leptospira kirschneri serovar Sokoine str. RM1]|nr:hypothetical protein LEP1GSC065_2795 [Leptospira kirschneri serovar Sokoine str. RM1]